MLSPRESEVTADELVARAAAMRDGREDAAAAAERGSSSVEHHQAFRDAGFRCAQRAVPHGQALPVGGGWRVSGRWDYSSGTAPMLLAAAARWTEKGRRGAEDGEPFTSRLEAIYRDVSMYRTHIGAQYAATATSAPRAHLGLPFTGI